MRLGLTRFLWLLPALWLVGISALHGCLWAQAPPFKPAVIGTQHWQLETTPTPQAQAKGLMGRTQLPPKTGMLFEFNPPRAVPFWMAGCQISLDLIWIRQGQIVGITPNVPPCLQPKLLWKNCPLYNSPGVVDSVIEVPGQTAEKNGWQAGLPVWLN